MHVHRIYKGYVCSFPGGNSELYSVDLLCSVNMLLCPIWIEKPEENKRCSRFFQWFPESSVRVRSTCSLYELKWGFIYSRLQSCFGMMKCKSIP